MFADLLSEAQKAAIAEVAIAHAELESELDRCIIELCKLFWPHGAILLESARVERKLDIFSQLLETEFRESEVPPLFRTTCAALKDLNTQRNTIIHGQWTLRSMATYDVEKPPRRGQALIDIERKDIVAHRSKRGKQRPAISARHIKRAAELLVLNRRLLHQLFWEHFSDRVNGLGGLPEKPDTSAEALAERIRKRNQQKH